MKTNFFKQHKALYILVGLFIIPILAAHYVFSQRLDWVSGQGSNYGQLIQQAVVWQTGAHPRPWQLAFVVDGQCQQDCLATLDKLSRLRLSMGRKLYDLDLVLVFKPKQQPGAKLQSQLDSQNIVWASLSAETFQQWAQVFKDRPIILFGPTRQAVLNYPLLFQSNKMAHDLQLLIK